MPTDRSRTAELRARLGPSVLTRRRVGTGWLLAVVGLPLLTVALSPLRTSFGPDGALPELLLAVVVVAVIGGLRPGVAGAVIGLGFADWFLVPPVHSLTIDRGADVTALVTFVVVAVIVATLVDRLAGRALREARARDEAEALARTNDTRTALLAALSHDLRTPLASIKACSSSLLSDEVTWSPDDVRTLHATIDTEADRLDRLVTNLLDLSRLQTGALTLETRAVGLEEVVWAAVASLSGDTSSLVVDVPESLPPVVVDPALLERSVANLMANARAWSPPDRSVRVVAGAVGDHLDLRIIDCGPGIPEADRRTALLPFQRPEVGGGAAGDGVGLGLAVARGFVAAMSGRLSLEDTPGGGLTAVISLPVSAAG